VKITDGVLGLPSDGRDSDGKQSDEVETMVVTLRLFASYNGEAMQLELLVQHGQDGYNDERCF
jgi:hypothetical protein